MMITILGPTATGKTELAARIAHELNGEVISADSRQVYRGMTIGTGKDYDDYTVNAQKIPYHLIDIVDPGYEYNIFEYQKDFLNAYNDIISRNKLPVLCGGSGMYLEAVLKGYKLEKPGDDDDFIASLEDKSDDELVEILKEYKTLHNITDFENRARLLNAIRIAHAANPHPASRIPLPESPSPFPAISSTIFGINYPRGLVKARIRSRLEYRLEHGMVEEVERLLQEGIAVDRLMKYGLEYKFVTLFLLGKLSRQNLLDDLNIAIRQFAKRQMTWYRRMEKQGLRIYWIDGRLPLQKKVDEILWIVRD